MFGQRPSESRYCIIISTVTIQSGAIFIQTKSQRSIIADQSRCVFKCNKKYFTLVFACNKLGKDSHLTKLILIALGPYSRTSYDIS